MKERIGFVKLPRGYGAFLEVGHKIRLYGKKLAGVELDRDACAVETRNACPRNACSPTNYQIGNHCALEIHSNPKRVARDIGSQLGRACNPQLEVCIRLRCARMLVTMQQQAVF
jgi:hypothetical protein